MSRTLEQWAPSVANACKTCNNIIRTELLEHSRSKTSEDLARKGYENLFQLKTN